MLLHQVPWVPLKNDKKKILRHTAWMVAPGCSCAYTYGTITMPATEIPTWLLSMVGRWLGAIGLGGQSFPDGINLNRYDHGAQTMGWHADGESLFQSRTRDTRIVSISLGATRAMGVAVRLPDGKLREGSHR